MFGRWDESTCALSISVEELHNVSFDFVAGVDCQALFLKSVGWLDVGAAGCEHQTTDT